MKTIIKNNDEINNNPLYKITFATLEITDKCNYNCKHCYIHDGNSNQELPFSFWKKCIDYLCELGVMEVLLTGGEALLHKNFVDILHYCKKKGLFVNLFTNVSTINTDIIKQFNGIYPDNIEVSVYGSCKEVYEKITQVKNSYSMFLNGIALLKEYNLQYTMKTPIMKSNYNDVLYILDYMRNNSKTYYIDPILIKSRNNTLMKNKDIDEERLTPQQVAEIDNIDKRRIQEMISNPIGYGVGKILFDKSIFTCSIINKQIIITYDGYMQLCTNMCGEDFKVSVIDVNNSHDLYVKYCHLVDNINDSKKICGDVNNKCKQCVIRTFCHLCPALAKMETGSYTGFLSYYCDIANERYKNYLKYKKMD